MREWLRGLLGRTKLDRIEGLLREQAAAAGEMRGEAARASALLHAAATQLHGQLTQLQVDVPHLVALAHKHQEQLVSLCDRYEQFDVRLAQFEAGLAERDELRQHLQDEKARARALADQTGHLLAELGAERSAVQDLRARTEVSDDLRARCDAAERSLGVARRECDGLRANVDRLESASDAVERARAALEAELARVVRQRDELLRSREAGGAAT